MSRIALTRFSFAVPVVMLSQAAFADLTPEQVWGDWKQYLAGMGYVITADEAANGGDLTVNDLSISMQMPEASGTFAMTLGTITFAQDGAAVNIVMPEALPMTVNVTPSAPGEDPVSMQFNYTQTGHSMVASGSSEEITYDYNAATMGLVLSQLQVGADTFGEENAKVNVSGTGLSSKTTMRVGDLRDYSQTGAIKTLQYDIAIDNPEEPVKVKMNGGVTAVSFDAGGIIPLSIQDATDMAAMLKAGFAVQGTFNYGSGNTNIDVTDPDNGDFAATTSSEGGSLGVQMDAQTLAYSGGQDNVKMNVKVADLPFPIDLSMARAAFNLSMPISKSDTTQDFAFGLTMGDFVMSDMIWSIFDPTTQLPRDPATIEVGLSGKAKLLVDIMDPEAAASAAAPGELEALTVDKLLVNAVGAKLEGNGDFTFDNSDTTTFPGMPKPVGAVNLSLAGGNGLIDKLVAMGLLPEEQAMGARMMMGLFAVPGDAPDTLSSKVEFTSEGQVLANGQRIK